MTCVLQPAPISFPTSSSPSQSSMRWSPMTTTSADAIHSAIGLSSNSSYSSNNAGYRKSSDVHMKKRASRAGTRSVSTLSAAQLERKRANDREAQRAIRQRTKDHIDGLEKTLNDLKETLENREKLLTAAHQRNRELEDENVLLRMRLNDAPALNSKFTRPQEQSTIASAPQSAVSETSGSLSHRSGSIGNAQHFGLTNGHATNAVNGSWSQQPNYANTNGSLMIQTNTDNSSRNMAGWRARESPITTTNDALNGLHPPLAIPYTPTAPPERQQWTPVGGQYDFAQSTQNQQQYQQPVSAQSESHFNQSGYQQASQQPQEGFHPPLLLPQNEFQAINNANFYQFTSQAQSFPQQYHAQGQAQAQVQPSNVSSGSYNNTSTSDQSFHPPMQFRDDADLRAYNMSLQAG